MIRPAKCEASQALGALVVERHCVTPRNLLDDHGLTAATIDPPHPVHQEVQKSPERDELVTPFRQLIVTGRRMMATGTNRRRALAGTHGDFDSLMIGTKTGMLV